ncbi:MAG: right-handed parallel beta-helix repeat-containing protein [Planctomycetota bacterium]
MMPQSALLCVGLSAVCGHALAGPVVTLTTDNTHITQSCTIVVPPGTVIADADGNGVIQIDADGITIDFAYGTTLVGAAPGVAWDKMKGEGIRLQGRKNVTIRNARVSGYKVALHAEACEGLHIAGAEFDGNFRQRLKSTTEAEDGADWLFPHHDDEREWITQWGAAMYIRDASNVRIHDVKVRRGQNGILLHGVNDSKIYDNDCSFLSGWGLGMFRSSRNTVSRNAFDFCVRGHSEGVYNRGQDSAGILAFEQCSGNTFAQNSVTHGGDGFFGFAGVEALNGEGAAPGYDHTRKGCNDNLFIDNDFSFAPAHGLELTFSFGNKVIRNRFEGNAICGVWGGYSQDFLIAGNHFELNGGMGYGLERGGVDIEHGAGNVIVGNTFTNNRTGVHLWWKPHGEFESKTWGKANYKGVVNNVISGNTFTIKDPFSFVRFGEQEKVSALHLRDESPDTSKFKGMVIAGNTFDLSSPRAVERDIKPGIAIDAGGGGGQVPKFEIPKHEVLGNKRPVGARDSLRGRETIVMGEWGPWDHVSPMIRPRTRSGAQHVYDVFGAGTVTFGPSRPAPGVEAKIEAKPDGRRELIVSAEPGIRPYKLSVDVDGVAGELTGTVFTASWGLKLFPWTPETDPTKNLDGWRGLASSPQAVSTTLPALSIDYVTRGPADMNLPGVDAAKAPGRDHFGCIATTRVFMPAGSWRFSTLSDDGVRVTVAGKMVLENWTWHAPTRNDGVYVQPADGEVEIVVEHFEINGHAVLKLDITPVP